MLTYRWYRSAGATNETSIAAALTPTVQTLLLSKLVWSWRRRTSCMRGCCHCPGVDVPGVDDCGVGVCVGVVFCLGVRSSFGRMVVVFEGVSVLEEEVRPLGVEVDRTREVVDMMSRGRFAAGRPACADDVRCAVVVSMLVQQRDPLF